MGEALQMAGGPCLQPSPLCGLGVSPRSPSAPMCVCVKILLDVFLCASASVSLEVAIVCVCVCVRVCLTSMGSLRTLRSCRDFKTTWSLPGSRTCSSSPSSIGCRTKSNRRSKPTPTPLRSIAQRSVV